MTAKKLLQIISTILVALVALLAVALVGVRLAGIRTFTVLSGSMEPTYHVGSLIYVKKVDPTTIRPGQVITFMLDENTVATHRVVEVVPDEDDPSTLRFRTKGDANDAEDGSLVHYKNVIGTPVFAIPKLGYAANYIQHPPRPVRGHLRRGRPAAADLPAGPTLRRLRQGAGQAHPSGQSKGIDPSVLPQGSPYHLLSFYAGGKTMKARNRIKPLLTLCCALLLVAAGVFGTLAYLTGTDTVNNTFTVGNVKITLDEAKVTTDGTPVEGADRVKANEYHLLPGHTYTKDPTVTVEEGSDLSYVRMKVTFNNAKAIIALCTDPEFAEDGPTGVENAYPLIRMVNFVEANAAKWDGIIPDNMMDTEEMLANAKYFVYDKPTDTLTYYFYYNETVAAPDGDVVLPVLFDKVTLPEWVTNDQLATLENFQITVVAEAIQADGFANAGAAWAAFHG